MDFISDYFIKFSKDCLNIPYAKIKNFVEELKKLRENNGRLFILGVGVSAGNASHAVNDLKIMQYRSLCSYR
jgi:D-sedoheptulose 7-phosphate isomerase